MATENTVLSIIERANHLLTQLTLEEKVSQLVHDSPAIERLGIKKYNWWNECLHGVARAGVATVFPQAIGMAGTWNKTLIKQVADVISDEARAKHPQLAAFDDYAMEGRTYRYFSGETLFNFGYGLSYSKFEYCNLQMPGSAPTDETFIVFADVQNKGTMDSDEVVQLYIPRIETAENYLLPSLQGFTKIHLKAGDKKSVSFNLSHKNFAVIQDDLQRKIIPGRSKFPLAVANHLYTPLIMVRLLLAF